MVPIIHLFFIIFNINTPFFLDSNKLLIGKEGAIKGLVAMLKSTDEEAKLKAATTITVLAFKNGNVFNFIFEALIGLF